MAAKSLIRLVSIVWAIIGAACAPRQPPRDVVVMKVGEREAHVRLVDERVSVGDEVVIRRKHCTLYAKGSRTTERCTLPIVGRARVLRLLGGEYSAVQIYSGTFREGDLVERSH